VRTFTGNLERSTTGSSLHCVWVPVHDDRRDRLVSTSIDPDVQQEK
jgi:hypothetical protein